MVHGETDQPEIARIARTTDTCCAQDVKREEGDESSLQQALQRPHEEVGVVEDATFLADEVYLRK